MRGKAHDCDFSSNCDDRILEHLIQTIENKILIQKCISKSWTLQEFLTEAGQIEDISLQMRDMKVRPEDRDIAKVAEYRWRTTRAHRDPGHIVKYLESNSAQIADLRFIWKGRAVQPMGKDAIFARNTTILQRYVGPRKADVHRVLADNQAEVTIIKGNTE